MSQTPKDTAKFRNKRNRTERAADLALCESLALRGQTHVQIAETISAQRKYSITRQMVTHDLQRLRSIWLESTLVSYADARAMELRKLDTVESELWEEWLKSKLADTGSNPAFTGQILGIHDRRAKLLGLLAPARTEVTGADGASIKIEATAIPAGPIDDAQKMDVLRRHLARMEAEVVATAATDPLPSTPAN